MSGIHFNMSTLVATKNFTRHTDARSSISERLSTGLRINRAADDASGLSISQNMRAETRSWSQAKRNISDGIALLQVTEGSLDEISKVLLRLKEMSVQAANGTLKAEQRAALDQERGQLLAEIDRIAGETEFNGQKVFTEVVSGGADSSSKFLDIEGDGDADMVVINSDQFKVLRNTGTGTYEEAQVLDLGVTETSVTHTDVDNDGDEDAVVTNRGGNEVVIVENDGNGSFSKGQTIAAGTSPFGVTHFDIDQDGAEDLITAGMDNKSHILTNDGEGGFSLDYSVNLGASARGITHADLDNDGDEDGIVAMHAGNVQILDNDGGTLTLGASYATGGTGTFDAAAFDMDHDGDLDVFTANMTTNSVSVFENDGAGNLSLKAQVGVNGWPSGMSHADLNGDGFEDIATSSSTGFNISVLMNDGEGNFTAQSVAVGGTTKDVTSVDLDGDGDMDLLTGTNSVAKVLRNDGSGSFSVENTGTAALGNMAGGTEEEIQYAHFEPEKIQFAMGIKGQENTELIYTTCNASSTGLAIAGISLSSQGAARSAMDDIDMALATVSRQRAEIGGKSKQLESAYETASTAEINITSALSRIRDADMAEETAGFIKQDILVQASSSVLAQANFSRQVVLSLIG